MVFKDDEDDDEAIGKSAFTSVPSKEAINMAEVENPGYDTPL